MKKTQYHNIQHTVPDLQYRRNSPLAQYSSLYCSIQKISSYEIIVLYTFFLQYLLYMKFKYHETYYKNSSHTGTFPLNIQSASELGIK